MLLFFAVVRPWRHIHLLGKQQGSQKKKKIAIAKWGTWRGEQERKAEPRNPGRERHNSSQAKRDWMKKLENEGPEVEGGSLKRGGEGLIQTQGNGVKECQQLGTLRDDLPGSELKNPGGERTGGDGVSSS